MTTIDLIHQELSKFHELTVSQLYKKLAGQPGISNSKSVSNALMRLKQVGRAANTFDAYRGLWVWRVVKNGEQANPQSDCQSAEMASDVAELEQPQPVVNESLTTEADTEECSATVKDSLTVETPESFTDTWTNPPAVEFKAAIRQTTMSVSQAMSEFYSCGYDIKDLEAFLTGIEFAEKHHGISQ